jgi:hypothetical protein
MKYSRNDMIYKNLKYNIDKETYAVSYSGEIEFTPEYLQDMLSVYGHEGTAINYKLNGFPERRIFYIDVGVPFTRETIQDMINKYKEIDCLSRG